MSGLQSGPSFRESIQHPIPLSNVGGASFQGNVGFKEDANFRLLLSLLPYWGYGCRALAFQSLIRIPKP